MTKITGETKNVLVIVDGTPEYSKKEVEKALKDAVELIIKFNGGKATKQGIVF